MSRWIDFSIAERKAMIQRVIDMRHIDEMAAEKDWWVTSVLYALFHTSIAKFLIFKGGTSLSKGWDLINRFSEDVDVALDRSYFLEVKGESCAKCTSNTQIHHLREKGHDFILNELKEELKTVLSEMGLTDVIVFGENEQKDEDGNPMKVDHDKDPSVIFVQYPSLYSGAESYASPVVKIEISVLSMSEPFEIKRISSLINQTFAAEGIAVDEAFAMEVKTVSPARTFLEKAFLLCEEFQKEKPRTRRLTRHFYDLERLSHTDYAAQALADATLYHDIVEHRKKFYHVGYVDYSKELPETITILPPDNLLASYEADYKDMQSSFIYAESLSFDELMQAMKVLQNRFRGVAIKIRL
ncbi:MAG: nucleotidyl transferase AbiEii/AbiGii toxin family protein [Bacteroidales bacterium]|nr:nucleotidyl transferase AbiEii/AbiGii toxin family protein [Bacteroidales bacterium]